MATFRCPLCGEIQGEVSPLHLKHKHNMTRVEFYKQFPEYKTMEFKFPYNGERGKWPNHGRKANNRWG